jgi:hypothetical protein
MDGLVAGVVISRSVLEVFWVWVPFLLALGWGRAAFVP